MYELPIYPSDYRIKEEVGMGLFAIRILSVFALLLNGIFPPFQMVSATPRAQGTVIETVRKGDTLQKVALRLTERIGSI